MCTITESSYTITETLIQTRKRTGSFRVCIKVLPASTQIPMASIGNSRMCRRQTGFDKLLLYRQNPCFPVQSSRIRVALKAVPTHATPPHLMRSALYQTL